MRDRTQVQIDFIDKAIDGAYTADQAKAELDQMEREFGDLAFLPGKVTRKPRPWTKADLKDLQLEAAAGAGSREFLEYLAEMGEEVTRTERRKRKIKIISAITAVVAAAAVIIAVVRTLRG